MTPTLDEFQLLKLLSEQISATNTEYNELVATLEERDQQLALAEDQRTALEGRLDVAVQRLESALEAGAELRSTLEKSRNELERVTQQLDEAQSAAVRLADLQRQVEKLRHTAVRAEQRADAAERELKELKAAGDPKRLSANLKEKKVVVEEQRKVIDKMKAELRETRAQLVRSSKRVSELEALPMFQSSTGEAIYANQCKLHVLEADGTGKDRVCLRYWHPNGIGRTVLWDGKQLLFASASLPGIKTKVKPSKEIEEFARNWFQNNVVENETGQCLVEAA